MQALALRRRRPKATSSLAGAGRRELADDDRAGAAVAFVAAFLGAGAARVLAQPVEDGARRRRGVDLDDGAAVEEADRTARHGRLDDVRWYTRDSHATPPCRDFRAAPRPTPRRASPSAAICSISAPRRPGATSIRRRCAFAPITGCSPKAAASSPCRREPPGEGWQRHDHAGCLVLPGFIDTHVHSPQIDVIASYGSELLDWLTTHTFPAEARHADAGACRRRRRRTSSTRCSRTARPRRSSSRPSTPRSVDALFAAAEARGMRVIAGKVLMDRNAPADLVDDVATGRARDGGADRALARPRPSRLCGDGALRADELARAARARRAALPRRSVALPADARRREPRRGALGARAVPGSAQLPRRLRRGRPAPCEERVRARHLARRRRSRRDRRGRRADRPLAVVEPVPRQRPVRLARRRGGRRSTSAWRATSAAAPACRCCATWPTPTRSRRSPASG